MMAGRTVRTILLCAALACSGQALGAGAGSVAIMRSGAFKAVPFDGTADGVANANLWIATTGLGQLGPGTEGLSLPAYRPGVCYLWARYDAWRVVGTPFESWPNGVRRMRVDSLGVNITGVTEFHNVVTRFYGVVNPTGTDMVLYAIDSIGTAPMPVSIGVSRAFTFQTTGDLDLLASGGDIRLLNDGAIRMKSTGGAYQASVYTSGTDILKLRPLATGQAVRIQNAADNTTNLEVADNGKTTALTMIADSTRSNGGIFVGAQKVNKILRASASLDFDLSAVNCQDLTVTVTGAALNDEVFVGAPNGSIVADETFSAWVSAANTVTVRACDGAGAGNPASGTYKVTVFQ